MILVVSTDNAINWNATGYDRLADNVANILKTRKGEVPFFRDMGIDPSYIDTPLTISKGGIINDAISAILDYEPRVSVNEIDVTDCDEDGNIAIKVVVNV
jgi:phage baseplate assembly protein W